MRIDGRTYLDDLPQTNLERKWLLACILCTPELFIHVAVLSVSSAVNSHALSALRKHTVAGLDESLDESHGTKWPFHKKIWIEESFSNY
jgi:hypothetical protein